MARPTINDVQLVEPVLTNLMIGYMQADDRFIAQRLFPALPVDKDSGTYAKFTKKYWFVDGLKQRAPGDTFQRAGYGIESGTYKTLQWGLEHKIPTENRANSQVPMDLEEAGVRWLAQQSLIRKEREIASVAFATNKWGTDNTSATDWDDYASSDPVNDVRTARRTISQNTGQRANTIAMGEIVYDALLNHPDIIDRLKYVERATEDNVRGALASIFGLDDVLVSLAVYNSANVGQDASMTAIIDDDALVAFVDPNPTMFAPAAGKTFVWEPGGGVGSILDNYYENQTRSDVLQHAEQWDIAVTASDVGYFFSDIVT